MKIKILNPIYSEIDDKELVDKIIWIDKYRWTNKTYYKVTCKDPIVTPEIKDFIKEPFEFKSKAIQLSLMCEGLYPNSIFDIGIWKRKQQVRERKSLVIKGKFIYTGYVEKIKSYCKQQGIECEVSCENEDLLDLPYVEPNLKGITFREDQLKLLHSAFEKKRGILISPTGSGKTVLAGGIFSAYKNHKCLFLCHTRTLVEQTYNDFIAFGLGKCTIVEGGQKDYSGNIVISTMQSFTNSPKENYYDFDVVIIDECHHVSFFEGTYVDILKQLSCTVRIGLTATESDKQEGRMAAEGLLGPLIDEFSLDDGIEQGILAVPKIKILKIPTNLKLRELKNYQEVYSQGIVFNKVRHRIIMKAAKSYNEQGLSCLILIGRIEHGRELMKMAELIELDCVFIQGETESAIRSEVKTKLKAKSIYCVIATTIWKEGVNIPSLDVIINANGGKSEISTLQSLGRGLRTTKDKTEVILVDFFDNSHPFFINHFGERISLYCDIGIL